MAPFGDKYLDIFAAAVRNRRADDFYDNLQKLLKPSQLLWLGIDKVKASEVLSPNRNLLIAAFHYTSPSIGKWHRVVLEPLDWTVLDLKPLELAQHAEAYSKAPMDINIPVWKNLKKPLWIKLGDATENLDLHPQVSLSSAQKTRLQELFEDFDNTQFYDLILGLDKVTDHQKANDSFSQLKGALTGIANLRFPLSLIHAKFDSRDELIWRAFVFSFFLAIRLREAAWVLVLPLREEGLGNFPRSEAASWLPATYVAALKNPDRDFEKTAKAVLLPIVRMLTNVELHSMEAFGSQSVVVLENTVRLCTMIDEQVQQDANQYRKRLSEKLWKLSAGYGTVSDTNTESLLRETLEMTGADPQMLALLDRLQEAALSRDSDTDLKPGKTFFLYSEPGCGKERLAHLCHLFSRRAGGIHPAVVKGVEDLIKRRRADQLANWIGNERADKVYPSSKAMKRGGATPPLTILSENPSFGYTTFNSGLLNEKNFEDLMFSSAARPGALYLTHLLGGTLFLDECNTLEPRLANQLLRAFEDPYQIIVRDNKSIAEVKINVQVVFGSNRSPDQLLSDGFNSAVVFRIAKQPFHIPPLRDRKVDIAIFVNGYFVKHNEDLAKNGREHEQLRRISLEGLRVICELPWPDNYRGVKGLLDDILETRAMRGVKGREVSFDEVIQAVARREGMGGGARSDRTGHTFSGTIR